MGRWRHPSGVMLLMCEMLATGLDGEGWGCSGVDVRLRLLFLHGLMYLVFLDAIWMLCTLP